MEQNRGQINPHSYGQLIEQGGKDIQWKDNLFGKWCTRKVGQPHANE